MIVPTLTMFGRVRECTREVSKVLLATGAVVTGVIMASAGGPPRLRVRWRGGRRDLPVTWRRPARGRSDPGGSPAPRAVGTRLARVSTADAAAIPATVLVYSHRPEVRSAVRTAVGRRPAADVGPLSWVEAETGEQVISAVDHGGIDLCILDGESQPIGGMALSRQLEEEVPDRPLVCLLIARQQDRWLAHWSMADATMFFPVDPLTVPDVVAELLRHPRPAARY
jgi:hypothetical protein